MHDRFQELRRQLERSAQTSEHMAALVQALWSKVFLVCVRVRVRVRVRLSMRMRTRVCMHMCVCMRVYLHERLRVHLYV